MPSGFRGPALRNISRDDFDKMIDAGIIGEDEHVELVNGRIVQMSPEAPWHAATIDLCAEALRLAFGPGCTVRVQHPLRVEPDGEPEPDIAVVRGGPREHGSGHPNRALLLVEVAGTSLQYDRQVKALLYARAEFAEYWIVNLPARCLEVHRDPSPAGYRRVTRLESDASLTPLAAGGVVIPVQALLL
jgi:Uma2 family endonuclease